MLYAIICIDRPDAGDMRAANRPAHLEFIEAQSARVVAAGPFRDEITGAPTGSLLIVRADSLADAQSFAALDPYARAGLFASVDIRPWVWLINRPDGLAD
jgi:uncharacterized protein YciI